MGIFTELCDHRHHCPQSSSRAELTRSGCEAGMRRPLASGGHHTAPPLRGCEGAPLSGLPGLGCPVRGCQVAHSARSGSSYFCGSSGSSDPTATLDFSNWRGLFLKPIYLGLVSFVNSLGPFRDPALVSLILCVVFCVLLH